jgi:hypothetical protein
MPRPHDTERYELTDTEKRDLIALIEKGKPLPDRYRFLLFEDKREGELVWNGRTREVCTAVLPFQTLELVSAEHSCAVYGGGEGDRHLRERHDDLAAGECGLSWKELSHVVPDIFRSDCGGVLCGPRGLSSGGGA